MKSLLVILFTIFCFSAYGQTGSGGPFSGVKLRVNDSTTYRASMATAHSQGYGDIYFNNQATVKHYDFWNGSAYEHLFFNGGGGGITWIDGNGTTFDTDHFNLGGTLSQTTTIDGDGHTFGIGNVDGMTLGSTADLDMNVVGSVNMITSGGAIGLTSGAALDLNASNNINMFTPSGMFATAQHITLATSTGDIDFAANNDIRLSIAGDLQINSDPGTATQVLTSNGAGVPPTWTTPSAGTADNGITKTGSNFRLGGSFVANTTMDGGGWHLNLGLNGNRLGDLRGWANNISWDATTSANFQVGSSSLGLTSTNATLNAAADLNLGITNALNINGAPGTSGQVLTSQGSSPPIWTTPSGGGGTFVGLTDGPGAFTGKTLNYTRVNAGETALEYRTPSQVRTDIGAGTGSGDVVGPASATADVPALFSGTTGKLIKNSTPTGTGNPVMHTSPTFAGTVITAASATGGSGFNLPHGVAPTSPVSGDLWTTTSAVFARINGTTQALFPYSGGILTGKVTTVASATGTAGFNLPHGAAPTSPVDGDLWTTTANVFTRTNGATRTLAALETANTWTNTQVLPASVAGGTGLRLPHGVAPTSPVNGDIWSTTANWFVRTNSGTRTLATLETANTWTQTQTFGGISFNSGSIISGLAANLILFGNSSGTGAINSSANLFYNGTKLHVGPTVATTLTGPAVFSSSNNAEDVVTSSNTNNGTTAKSGFSAQVGNNASVSLRMLQTNSSFTPTGIYEASASHIVSAAAGGLNISTTGTTGTKIWHGGVKVYDFINTGQTITVNSGSSPSADVAPALLSLVRTTPFTPATGIGLTAFRATVQTTAGNELAGSLDVVSTDISSGSEDFDLNFNAATGGTLTYIAKLNGVGGLTLPIAGQGISIKEGTNAAMGVATLVAGTITVNNTRVTANSRISLTVQSLGTVTVPTAVAITAKTAATSFTITSADVVDTSVVFWEIIEPAP